MSDGIKSELSDDFALNFFGREEKFLYFINSQEVAVKGNYRETWDFIKKDLNSVNRNSNLHLFFE